MTWLMSPLVGGGTVLSACAGHFRRLGTIDVVIATSGVELQLFHLSQAGKLTHFFSQSVLCHIRQLQVLQLGHQGHVDQLVALLETGSLVLLQYHQELDRFIVGEELSLVHGAVEADHLGHRLAVASHGRTIAVAAARGRIACLSCSFKQQDPAADAAGQLSHSTAGAFAAGCLQEQQQQPHAARNTNSSANQSPWASSGAQQLSEPVVYAAAALSVAGAVNYGQSLHDSLELGDIDDLAFFSCSGCLAHSSTTGGCLRGQQDQLPLDYLAVLSYRYGEGASEVVVFSWDAASAQLKKLGLVTLAHHGKDATTIGQPLHLAAVPSCSTAMALIGSNAVLVLDFSPILQHSRSATAPAKAFVAATVEVLGKHTTHDDCMARELQRKQLPLWVQATRLQRAELHVFVGRCVTPAVAKAGDILMRQQGSSASQPSACDSKSPQRILAGQWMSRSREEPRTLEGLQGAEPAAVDNTDRTQDYDEVLEPRVEGALAALQPESASESDTSDIPSDVDNPDYESYDDNSDDGGSVDAQEVAINREAARQSITECNAPEARQKSMTAWAWMTSSRATYALEATAATHPMATPAATPPPAASAAASAGESVAAGRTAVDSLVLVNASGSFISVSLLVEHPASSSNLPASSSNLPATSSNLPASSSNLPDSSSSLPESTITDYQQTCRIYVSGTRQLIKLPAGATDFLAALPGSLLLAITDSKSTAQVLGPVPAAAAADPSSTALMMQQSLSDRADAAEQEVPATLIQHQQQQTAGVWLPTAASATAAATPPYSQSTNPAAGSSLLGSALGHLDNLQLNSMVGQQQQQQGAADLDNAAAAAGMELNSPTSPAAAAAYGRDLGLAAGLRTAGMPNLNGQDSGSGLSPAAAAAAAGVEPVGADEWHVEQRHRQQDLLYAAGAWHQQPWSGAQQPKQTQFTVLDDLHLLGPIGSCAFVQRQWQHETLCHVSTCTSPSSGHNAVTTNATGVPTLIAASRQASGGLKVTTPGLPVRQLQSGPVDMLRGATGMWPVRSSQSANYDSVLVITFATATRAMLVGETFTDVSDVLGIQTGEATVLAACVGDGVMMQVTPSCVKLCLLGDLLCGDHSSNESSREWSGSVKSSRCRQLQQQHSSSSGSSADHGAVDHCGAVDSAVRIAHGTAWAAAPEARSTADAHIEAGNADRMCHVSDCEQQQQQCAVSEAAAGRGGAAEGSAAGQSYNEWSVSQFMLQQQPQERINTNVSGSCDGTQETKDLHPQQQQQQQCASIVLAAAVPGAAALYLTSGHLVLLEVSQQQQQHVQTNPISSSVAMQAEPSLASIVSTAGIKTTTCRKRGRLCWSLTQAAVLQLDDQVSCLQFCNATVCSTCTTAPTGPAGAATVPRRSSSCRREAACSHFVFAGCYDGSVRMYAAQVSSSNSSGGCVQLISRFNVDQLHPLRLLLKVTAGPSTRTAAAHAVSPAVPESCLLIPTTGSGGDSGRCGEANKCGSLQCKDRMPSLCLQLAVSYRNGDVVLYQITADQAVLQSSSQSAAVASPAAAAAAAAAGAAAADAAAVTPSNDIQLTVLSQLRVPGVPPKLQLLCSGRFPAAQGVGSSVTAGPEAVLNPEKGCHQVLVVSDQLWALQISRSSQKLKLQPLLAPQSQLAVAVQLPLGLTSCHEAEPPRCDSRHELQQQQQQSLACVTSDGRLQLLACCLRQQQQQPVQTWLEGVQVQQVIQHPESQLLLATCKGPGPGHSLHRGVPSDGNTPQMAHIDWLQCLDTANGSKVAAYQPSGGQNITCLAVWDAAADAFTSGACSLSDTSSNPEQRQQQQQCGTPRGSSRTAFAAAVGAIFGRRRTGTGGPSHGVTAGPARGRSGSGTLGGARSAHSGAQGVPGGGTNHVLSCSSPGSPITAGQPGHFMRQGGTCSYTSHRVGPLVVLGTEITDTASQVDGCKGQVLVLQLTQHKNFSHARAVSEPAAAAIAGSSTTAAAGAAAAPKGQQGTATAGKQAAGWHPLWGRTVSAPAVTDPVAVPSTGPTYTFQRVARLRMPDRVTAISAFSGELLLVAVSNVLAVYRVQHGKLQQAAHCFTRAPIVALSVANDSDGLVLAADRFQGVTAFQVSVHATTSEVSVQAIAAHTDVRHVQDVCCLPAVPAGREKQQSQPQGSNGRCYQHLSAAVGRAHSLCLDSEGSVLELAWAKQRAVPAPCLVTVACMSLGAAAAALVLPQKVSQVAPSNSSSNDRWRVKCAYELTGSEDVPAHWQDPLGLAAAGRDASTTWPLLAAAGDAAASAVAAAANGTVLHLQQLSVTEGRLLQLLESVILQHPLTRILCIGGGHLLNRQTLAEVCSPPANRPKMWQAVDARALQVLLLLPHDLQQKVLQQAGLGSVMPRRVWDCLQEAELQQVVLDAVLCRLQVLPSWD